MTLSEKKIVRMISGAHVMNHLIEGAIPPLIPLLLAAFGVNYFRMGLVATVFSYAFGMGSFPAGILADRISPKKLLHFFLFASGLVCFLVLPVSSLMPFGIIAASLGLLGSLYHPCANTLISLNIGEKGRAFGINGISGSLGTAAVPFLAAWMGNLLGWKSPYLVFGILTLLAGVYALTAPAVSRGDRDRAEDPAEKDREWKPNKPLLVLFFASCAFSGLGSRGVLTFLPTYFGKTLSAGGINPVTFGGIVATITLCAGAAGQYAAGRLVDTARPCLLYIGAVFISMVSIFLLAAGSGPLVPLGAMGFAFFSFSYQPVQNYLISKLFPPKRHGLGYGFLFFMNFGVASLSSALAGHLADSRGFGALFYAMTGFYFIAFVCTALMPRLERKREKLQTDTDKNIEKRHARGRAGKDTKGGN
jgi:MFS family permease